MRIETIEVKRKISNPNLPEPDFKSLLQTFPPPKPPAPLRQSKVEDQQKDTEDKNVEGNNFLVCLKNVLYLCNNFECSRCICKWVDVNNVIV